jgi:hypothetical protein
VTTEELDGIIDTLLQLAREGDVAAAKLIFQYTLGKPLEARDPDRLDADEVEAFRANAMTTQTKELVNIHPLELFLPLFRLLIDAKGGADLQQFAELFTQKFGADGLSGTKGGKREAAAPPPSDPTAEQTAPPQTAAPKPATVSKRKQTGSSLPMDVLPDILPDRLPEAATPLPGVPTPPPDGKREPTADRSANGRQPRHKPPSPPHEAGRQQTEGTGHSGGHPVPSRTRAATAA